MYLFFTLHKKGIDVNSVYEAELKDVPTDRFNEWIKEQMDEEDQPPEISFESQASYEPIHEGPMPQPIRPHWVPKLVLDTIPDYVTSSDEDDNESLDGSKIHRKSEFVSEASMSFYGKEPAHTRYKEDYSLSKEKKILIEFISQKYLVNFNFRLLALIHLWFHFIFPLFI